MVYETFKGTRDMYGDDMRFKQHVINIIRETFITFGFEELETPTIEREKTLQGKYGQEGEKLIFRLKEIHEGGLRYDHTVPLARFMAANNRELVLPYRRFAIGAVYRAEKPQAGRFRQFTQCDFDTVGSNSLALDAEIVAINYMVLSRLGFTDEYVIQLNDRRLLNALAREVGFDHPDSIMAVFRTWDKLDKISSDEALDYLAGEISTLQKAKVSSVKSQLMQVYKPVTDFLLSLQGYPAAAVLSELAQQLNLPETQAAIAELSKLVSYVSAYNIPTARYECNPLLARGLSYYTGPIFETVVKTANIGSVTGGGRYDQLIANMGGPKLPATGSSFGLERVMTVMEKLGLRPDNMQSTLVLASLLDSNDEVAVTEIFKLATELRQHGIPTEIYSGDNTRFKNQLTLASRRQIPLVLIVGADEISQHAVTVKDLRERDKQITVPASQLVPLVNDLLGLS